MVNPLSNAFNWWLQFMSILPYPARAFLNLVFVLLLVFFLIHLFFKVR